MAAITTRPALGQVASLGTLYDARTDTFVPISLLSARFPHSAIARTDDHTTTFDYSESDSFKEKFSKMGFNAELQASFLGGLVNVEGSGSYLTESRNTNRVMQASMHYRIMTVHESLQFMRNDLKDLLAFENIDGSFATHVVAGITWGAYMVVTAKHHLSKHDTETDISGALKAKLASLQPDTSVDDKSSGYTFDIHIHGDVLPDDGVLPTTFEGAYEFITKVPQYISKTNGGKGKPFTYTLLPLSILEYMYPMEIAADITLVQLSFDTLEKFVQLFDSFRNAQLTLSDYQSCIKEHRNCIPAKYIKEIDDLKSRAKAREATLKSQFSNTLRDARSGRVEADKLWKLLDEFSTGDLSPDSITAVSGKYADKMDFVDLVTGKGAKYVGFSGMEHPEDVRGEIYVFHFNWNSQHHQPAFAENFTILLDLLRDSSTNQEAQIIVRDCDDTGETLEWPFISHKRNGAVVTEDLAEERRELADKCIMRYNTDFFVFGQQKWPIKMARVRLPCPGNHCSLDVNCDWICYKCRVSVLFGYDDTLYCDCGRCLYKHWSFQCKDCRHGAEWPKYQDERLFQLLNVLEPFDVLDILILGESGAGKSTLINAFVNYLTYDTLAAAMKAKQLNCIIPFSFTTQVVDKSDPRGRFVPKTIRAGFSNNERDGSEGQSATQKALVYVIRIRDCIVRLFDTPSIDDTRESSQDMENMADILTVLSKYEKLHGILILVKPNNARLTLMFRFHIKELLTHLHRDAARNIVFGFTNTRGSNYKPGDMFEPLRNELADVDIGLFENTVYCFDSESFSYLAAYYQGVDLGDNADYSRSWERSAKESQRLLTYFGNLTPYLVKSTASMNETRRMITELTKLMAEIMRTVNDAINVNQEQIKALSEDRLKKENLEKQLFVTMKTLIAYQLDSPKTVCAHADCVDHQDDGTDPNKASWRIIYKTCCHNPCYCLNNVQVDVIAHPEFINCLAFSGNNGFCKRCTHSWKQHMHVLYELRPEKKTVKSRDTEIKLNVVTSDMERKEIVIASKKAFIAEIQVEHDKIQRAAIQFCFFLKRSSIIPYNDVALDYLAFMIKEERGKAAVGGNPAKLEVLEKYRNQYQEQVNILITNMQSGDDSEILSEQELHEKVQELYSLKYYGHAVKQAHIHRSD